MAFLMKNMMVYEPKRINTYVIEFNEKFGINKWAVKKFDLPKFKDGKWEEIQIEFFDPISPSTTQALYKLIEDAEKNRRDNPKRSVFSFYINHLDPVGVVVETWLIKVKNYSIDFGYCDYECDNTAFQVIHMIIEPLRCGVVY